ncbi:MAG: MarR family winged helix-turn-helix transcriptional regulator [Candidatus Caccovivens sp.]
MQEKYFDIERMFLIKKIYEKALRKISITDKMTASYVCFAQALLKRDFYSQQELSDFVGCNKAHTSRTLLKMQLKGLLKPIKKDCVLSLTENGKAFANNTLKDKQQIICQLFDNIPEKDIDTFVKVLDQVLANAETLSETI